jgi:hypothetical protein
LHDWLRHTPRGGALQQRACRARASAALLRTCTEGLYSPPLAGPKNASTSEVRTVSYAAS